MLRGKREPNSRLVPSRIVSRIGHVRRVSPFSFALIVSNELNALRIVRSVSMDVTSTARTCCLAGEHAEGQDENCTLRMEELRLQPPSSKAVG